EAERLGEIRRLPTHFARVGHMTHRHHDGLHGSVYFHRVTTTLVPFPGVESMENSFIRRRAPGSPRPIPVPVVKPSLRAAVTSGMPGPSSTKVSRTPLRVPFSSVSRTASPPLPCSRVFRASSLAAVTTFV